MVPDALSCFFMVPKELGLGLGLGLGLESETMY